MEFCRNGLAWKGNWKHYVYISTAVTWRRDHNNIISLKSKKHLTKVLRVVRRDRNRFYSFTRAGLKKSTADINIAAFYFLVFPAATQDLPSTFEHDIPGFIITVTPFSTGVMKAIASFHPVLFFLFLFYLIAVDTPCLATSKPLLT